MKKIANSFRQYMKDTLQMILPMATHEVSHIQVTDG